MEKIPIGQLDVTNFRYKSEPYSMLECTVPGLSQEAFDRNWKPKATSLMCIDSVTRKYVIFQPLSAAKLDLPQNEDRSIDNSTNAHKLNDLGHNGETGKLSSSIPSKTIDPTIPKCSNNTLESQSNTQTFLAWRRIASEYFAFGACAEFTISRALYDPNVPKWRLDFRFTLGYIGACTLTHRTEFFSLGENGGRTHLWTNTYQLVMVDKETRQPTKVPSWFLEEYKGRGCMKKPLVIRPFRKPDRTYCHSILVQWSDTDEFGHATWSSYIAWSIDALHAALLPVKNASTSNATEQKLNGDGAVRGGRALRGITKETVGRGLSKFQVSYFKECLEGDQVDVHVWQEGEPGEVLCCMFKTGEEVCQVKLLYFSENEEDEILY